MEKDNNIKSQTSSRWEIAGISISHHITQYQAKRTQHYRDPTESVRLHFGLSGSYKFSAPEFSGSFDLEGHHNNILYSDGLTLAVHNNSETVETFGVNMTPESFVHLGQQGNEPLRKLTDAVIRGQHAMLSPRWKTNDAKMISVIQEIIACPHTEDLKDLFLLSKVMELLVLQAERYERPAPIFLKSERERERILEARDHLVRNLDCPPNISELARITGMNEYKLKKGFKEMFGTTVFGCIHQHRMQLAKRLLLGTSLSAKEIAYQAGYNSPQYFSRSFKKTFGISPNSIRKTPNSAT